MKQLTPDKREAGYGCSTRQRLGLPVIVVLAVLLPSCGTQPSTQAADSDNNKLPNIVFIIADDLGWRDLSIYGNTLHETPHLANLADRSLLFTNAYAAASVCSPSRAAILTGRYPAALHLTEHIHPPWAPNPEQKLKAPTQRPYLPLSAVTLAEQLKRRGYITAQVGKWHLARKGHGKPIAQGFDIAVTTSSMPYSYFYPYAPPDTHTDIFGAPIDSTRIGEYLTDRLTNEAIQFMSSHRDTTFFLYLAYNTVHVPIEGKPALVQKYQRKLEGETPYKWDNAHYAAMVESLDRNVGRLMSALNKLNVFDNTIIIFTSDNGGLVTREPPGWYDAHTPATTNDPLRLGKGYLYEGGIRVPMLIRWPGVTEGGTMTEVPASGIDLFPTISTIAGLKISKDVDGKNLVPVLKGSDGPVHHALFWHFPHYNKKGAEPSSAVQLGNFKLIEKLEEGKLELYNLRYDLGEENNLAEVMPDRADSLSALLDGWRDSIGAQMPVPNPAYDPLQ